MSFNRSISKIPYETLPKEIQDYLTQQHITDNDWNSTHEEKKHLIIQEYSQQTTANYQPSTKPAPLHQEMKIEKQANSDLLVGDVENIILEMASPRFSRHLQAFHEIAFQTH